MIRPVAQRFALVGAISRIHEMKQKVQAARDQAVPDAESIRPRKFLRLGQKPQHEIVCFDNYDGRILHLFNHREKVQGAEAPGTPRNGKRKKDQGIKASPGTHGSQ
jgi:hypothetical protein